MSRRASNSRGGLTDLQITKIRALRARVTSVISQANIHLERFLTVLWMNGIIQFVFDIAYATNTREPASARSQGSGQCSNSSFRGGLGGVGVTTSVAWRLSAPECETRSTLLGYHFTGIGGSLPGQTEHRAGQHFCSVRLGWVAVF